MPFCGAANREARRTASAQNNRYHRILGELSGLGIHAEPAVYDEEFADEVCEQLLKVDGVLVWVDPLSRGKTRALLDPMLRDVTPKDRLSQLSSKEGDVYREAGQQPLEQAHDRKNFAF